MHFQKWQIFLLLLAAVVQCQEEQALHCKVPEELFSTISQVGIGGSLTYSCRRGFMMTDEPSNHVVAVCQHNGNWSQSVPTCEGLGCTDDGNVCAFPFVYRGKYYDSCTTKDERNNISWCSETPLLTNYYGPCTWCNIQPNFEIYDPKNTDLYDQCSKTLFATETASHVALSNFPSNYENNFECHWTIKASTEKSQVEVTVNWFVSEGCCDFLKISDGSTDLAGNSVLVRGRLSQSYSMISSFGILCVLFRTDESITYATGLHFSYRQYTYDYCGGNLTANESLQTISSPGWPNNYTNNIYCKWIISAPVGYQVKLDIPQVTTEHCCDILVVRDGVDENSSSLLSAEGNVTISESLVSTDGQLLVVFRSNDLISAKGFTGTFVTTAVSKIQRPIAAKCLGEDLQAPIRGEGNFSLPPTPFTGREEFSCAWTLSAPEGQQVRVWFAFVFTQNTWIVIRDGDEIDSPKIGAINGHPHEFLSYVSTGGVLRVEVNAFPLKKNDTFFAYFDIYEPEKDHHASSCDGNFTAESSFQYISTPNWPGFYPPNLRCTWFIEVRENKYAHLHFLGIITEKDKDVIQVFSGNSTQYIVQMDGSINQRFTIFSTGEPLRIEFTSDGSGKYAGFRAAFEESDNPTDYYAGRTLVN